MREIANTAKLLFVAELLNFQPLRRFPPRNRPQDHLAKHLRRMARDAQRPSYDSVIVDPPAFGVGRGKLRVLRLLWPEIFASLRPSHVLLTRNDKALCGLPLRPYAPVDRLG